MTPEEATARQALIAETVACLAYGWHIRKIGEANSSVILCDESRHDRLVPSYEWIYLCDNGGEFNVGRINQVPTFSVAYTDGYGCKLDGGTMAYRVWAVLRGEEIDYDFRCADIIEDAKKAA